MPRFVFLLLLPPVFAPRTTLCRIVFASQLHVVSDGPVISIHVALDHPSDQHDLCRLPSWVCLVQSGSVRPSLPSGFVESAEPWREQRGQKSGMWSTSRANLKNVYLTVKRQSIVWLRISDDRDDDTNPLDGNLTKATTNNCTTRKIG